MIYIYDILSYSISGRSLRQLPGLCLPCNAELLLPDSWCRTYRWRRRSHASPCVAILGAYARSCLWRCTAPRSCLSVWYILIIFDILWLWWIMMIMMDFWYSFIYFWLWWIMMIMFNCGALVVTCQVGTAWAFRFGASLYTRQLAPAAWAGWLMWPFFPGLPGGTAKAFRSMQCVLMCFHTLHSWHISTTKIVAHWITHITRQDLCLVFFPMISSATGPTGFPTAQAWHSTTQIRISRWWLPISGWLNTSKIIHD